MTVNARPAKRIKRRITADLFDFFTFASSLDQPYAGPFRINVKQFFSQSARAVASSDPATMVWQMDFRVGRSRSATSDPVVVTLEVVEEDVARCQKIYCDHCRVVGWGRHPVCAKRYHFIIRNSTNQFKFRPQICMYCGSMLDPMESSRCLSCNREIAIEGLQNSEYFQIEDSTHLLHGLVHSNGYGHLVRINGVEGGSQILKGCDLMDFWDRICRLLRVRKITVMDISKKHNMEFRLLHAVSHGHPWYGKWGYQFGSGSFGLTFEAYKEALESLSTELLSLFFSNSRSPQCKLQDTIAFYQFLSDTPLVTVRDIFSFITNLLEWHTEESKAKSIVPKQVSSESCIWSAEEEENSFNTILKFLKATDPRQWVSWHTLKRATGQSVRSPELLGYCLRNLAGKTTEDGEVVVIRCNQETNTVEYGLQAAQTSHGSQVAQTYKPSRKQILNDLMYLYNMLLNPQTMHGYKPTSRLNSTHLSATKLLNCKHLMKHYDKEYDLAMSNPFSIQITCNINVVGDYKDTVCPPEILTLPVTATVGDLKAKAAKAVKETYLIYQDFEADELLDCKVASDTTQVKLLFGSRGNAFIKGRSHVGRRRLGIYRMEQGVEKWMVDCVCGAQDDDGERMLACDLCGVWQHTRCSDIKGAEHVPKKFVCRLCKGAPKKILFRLLEDRSKYSVI